MSYIEKLVAFIEKQRDTVKPELLADTQYRRLYHISPNPKIPFFVPREIQRTMPGEDETVKRVCTGISLLDCLRGYAVMLRDYLDKKANCAGKDEWLGGYSIYELSVEGSLKPSPILAPISEWSEERWLVNVEREDQRYVPRVIGKCFIDELRVDKGDHHFHIETYVIVEVDTEALLFAPGIVLHRGFYRLTVPGLEKYKEVPLDISAIEVQKLSRDAYNQAKSRQASLLSYDLGSLISRW